MMFSLCVSTTIAVVSRTHLVLHNCSTGKKPSLDDGMVKCPALCYIRIKDVMYTQFLLHRTKRYNREGGWETETGRLPHTRAPGGGWLSFLGHLIYGKEHAVTILYVAIDRALAVVSQRNSGWGVDLHLVGSQPQCLAVDPLHQEQVYCGTFDQGLWRSTDAGASWEPTGEGIAHEQVMAVAVSAAERG